MKRSKIRAQQIRMKSLSKKEVYRMLKIKGNVYLPQLSDINHGYISKIISREKKMSMIIFR